MVTKQFMVDLCAIQGWRDLSDSLCNAPYLIGTLDYDPMIAVAFLCGLEKRHKGACQARK